jgi:hypothetical protein
MQLAILDVRNRDQLSLETTVDQDARFLETTVAMQCRKNPNNHIGCRMVI